MKRLPLYISFVLLVALSVSITFWILIWTAPSSRPLLAPAVAEPVQPSLAAASHLFGGAQTASTAVSVQLRGIIRAARARDSVAILSVEGQPARALRENQELVDGLLLKKINPSSVLLSDHGIERQIALPELKISEPARSVAPVDGAPVK